MAMLPSIMNPLNKESKKGTVPWHPKVDESSVTYRRPDDRR